MQITMNIPQEMVSVIENHPFTKKEKLSTILMWLEEQDYMYLFSEEQLKDLVAIINKDIESKIDSIKKLN